MNPVEQKLHVVGVSKSYAVGRERREVLRGLDLDAAGGEIIGIIGASGCGKSTLLNIIGGLDSADGGSVELSGVEVTGLSDGALADYRRHHVGLVFQDHHLLDQCTVLENVLLPALAARRVAAARGWALELLGRVGLADRAEELPHRLSGGERQRVALVRALVNRPPLLLCDEPTGNLDAESGRQVVSLVVDLVRDERMIALVVTHNGELGRYFTRTMRMAEGALVAER